MNKKNHIRDAELVISYQAGNKEALSVLVKHWHREFCRTSYWVIKDADIAKDIAQDSWKVIIEKINTLKDPKSFKSWALRIVYNKSIDYIKKSAKERIKKERVYEENKIKTITKTSEDDIYEKKRMMLLKGIKSLPIHQQTVLQLFYVQEYSLKEMSEILNISVGTTKSRLFYAREKLKTILKEIKIV